MAPIESRSPGGAPPAPTDNDDDRLVAWQRELDALRKQTEAKIGLEDLEYIERVDRFSRRMGWLGRVLVLTSVTPVGFSAGVAALWIYKQLQTGEVGHTALHGTYDRFDQAPRFHASRFRWEFQIDEESWRYSHNVKHHNYTNILGRDQDLNLGYIRFTPHRPHRWYHRVQLGSFVFTLLNMGVGSGVMQSGLIDVYSRREPDELDLLEDRSWSTVARAHWKFLRKVVRYEAKHAVIIPALAGPLAPKLWLGHVLSDRARDVFTGLAIFSSHVGEELEDFPASEGARTHSRAQWYAHQVATTRNFEVRWPLSVLCGGLEHQIEHHLFPRLPPNRLRTIAPQVREICRKHKVKYESDRWPRVLRSLLRRVSQLSRP